MNYLKFILNCVAPVIVSLFIGAILMNPAIKMKSITFIHQNCRNSVYPRANIHRFPVPDHLVKWSEQFTDYKPVFYESSSLIGASWSDQQIGIYSAFHYFLQF